MLNSPARNPLLSSPSADPKAVLQRIQNQSAAVGPDIIENKLPESPLSSGTENHAPPSNNSLPLTASSNNSLSFTSSRSCASSSSVEIWCTPILPNSTSQQSVRSLNAVLASPLPVSLSSQRLLASVTEAQGHAHAGRPQHNAQNINEDAGTDALRVRSGKIEPLGVPAPATYADATNLAAQYPHIAEHILALPLGQLAIKDDSSTDSDSAYTESDCEREGKSSDGRACGSADIELPADNVKNGADIAKNGNAMTGKLEASASEHTPSRPNWALAPNPDQRKGKGKDKGAGSVTDKDKNPDHSDGTRTRRRKRGGGSRNKKKDAANANESEASRSSQPRAEAAAGSAPPSRASTPHRVQHQHNLPERPASALRHPLPAKPAPNIVLSHPANVPDSGATTPGRGDGNVRGRDHGGALLAVSIGSSRAPSPTASPTSVPFVMPVSAPLGGVGVGQQGPPLDMRAEVDALILELQNARYGLSMGSSGVPETPAGAGTHAIGSEARAPPPPYLPIAPASMSRAHTPPAPTPTPTPAATPRAHPPLHPARKAQPKTKWMRDRHGVLRPDLHLDTGAVRPELRLASHSATSSPGSASASASGREAVGFYAQNIRPGPASGLKEHAHGAEEEEEEERVQGLPVVSIRAPTGEGDDDGGGGGVGVGVGVVLPLKPALALQVRRRAESPDVFSGGGGLGALAVPARPHSSASCTVRMGGGGTVMQAASAPSSACPVSGDPDGSEPWPTLDEICAMKMKAQRSS